MELSAEDNLRLNVLLHQDLKAVRIDESKMIVHALTGKGEAKVQLNPNCKDEKYIRNVKALFSTHVMGSPGGYPVFLKRWTRMGQARNKNLGQLLLLGESEAVVAVVGAEGLNDELAARAWWAMPNSDNARRMLENPAVVAGDTGKELAEFLVEFLPFEEDQHAMIESVRLVLQPGLISEEQVLKLWSRARTKRSFYVGFMHALPDALPAEAQAHPALASVKHEDSAYGRMLARVFSDRGQAFVATAEEALKKPGDQKVVESLLDAIADYFAPARPVSFTGDDIEAIGKDCEAAIEQGRAAEFIAAHPELAHYVKAVCVLSCLSVKLVTPVFARTDAIGTGMRKKIKHITDPIFEQLRLLRS